MTPSVVVVIVIIIRFLSSGANQKRSANALARDLLQGTWARIRIGNGG